MNLLYFHVPKTAGSSINKFFSENLLNYHFHIESVENLNTEFCKNYQFLSGHVSYNRMQNILELQDWITFATFRSPLEYVVSHLKWVRKLADASEKERFDAHPKIFQDIALKMLDYDFSQPEEIKSFIIWLESINFYYFHNTQLFYMNQTVHRENITSKQVEIALKNMESIDFVGIQENLDEFMEIISYEFGWEIKNKPRVNVNENNYGFDISNAETQKALLPLYSKDIILYEKAKELFSKLEEQYTEIIPKDVIGYVDSIKDGKITGWIRLKNNLRKLTLELQLNGEIIQETKTSIFRQGLKVKQLHPTGICAFQFICNREYDLENINVKIKNTDIILPKISGL